jgi:hypothetical protein
MRHGITHSIAVFLLFLAGFVSAQRDDKPNSKDLRAIKPPGGVPLRVYTGPGSEISVNYLKKVTKRLESVPAEDLEKWIAELERLIGTKLKDGVPSARQACRTDFVTRLSVAFNDLDWNPKVANNLLKRAQSLPASEAKIWKEAFEALLKKEIGQTDTANSAGGPSWRVPLVLIVVDTLYEEQKYNADRAKKYLARLKQLTAEDVAVWKNQVDQFGGSELDAAVNIVLLDPFFPEEKFQREEFKTACEAKQ